jgi:protein associated with RNAse G/E
MDFGFPENFSSKDDSSTTSYKLGATFKRVWNALMRINKKVDAIVISSNTHGNVHSSQMPDVHGVNTDHDKRYYRKGEIITLILSRRVDIITSYPYTIKSRDDILVCE